MNSYCEFIAQKKISRSLISSTDLFVLDLVKNGRTFGAARLVWPTFESGTLVPYDMTYDITLLSIA